MGGDGYEVRMLWIKKKISNNKTCFIYFLKLYF